MSMLIVYIIKLLVKSLKLGINVPPILSKLGVKSKVEMKKEHRNKFGDEIPFFMSKLIVQKNHI
jgi:hypothetical protein